MPADVKRAESFITSLYQRAPSPIKHPLLPRIAYCKSSNLERENYDSYSTVTGEKDRNEEFTLADAKIEANNFCRRRKGKKQSTLSLSNYRNRYNHPQDLAELGKKRLGEER